MLNPHPMQMAHPRVPEQISNVVLKALSKNPADRYSSGKQFFAALEEAAKFEPVAPRQQHRINGLLTRAPGPNASQAIKVAPSPSASQTFKAVPSPSASRRLKPCRHLRPAR